MQAAEPAVEELFRLVDQDNNGSLEFHEVTTLFQLLAPQQSAESAQNAAVEALLLSDKNADTQLNRQEFVQMLTRMAELSGLPLHDAAQRLLTATKQQQQLLQQPGAGGAAAPAPAPAHPQGPAAAAVAAAVAAGVCPTSQAAATGQQLQSLFGLWDKAGDGRISFPELCQGLSKLGQPVKHKQDITALITEAGGVLAAHDADGDRQLDLAEFTAFMQQFMAAAGFQLHEVLDELILLAQTKPDNEKLQKVLAAAEPQVQRMLSH